MKILLIEDNKDIAINIIDYLKLDGHIVAWNSWGKMWEKNTISYDYDVVLLDLGLPDTDGIEVCKNIRKKKEIPIIIITAKDSIDERVLWLESGANDYLLKPFDLRELVARIHAVTRGKSQKKIQIGDVDIDFDTRTFIKAWKAISLTQKEFLIFEYICKNSPRVLSRTDIIQHVWGWEDDLFWADAKLDVYISNIRTKFWKNIIVTIKGVGYKIGGIES